MQHWWRWPEIHLLRFGVVFSLGWEALQSPLYTDTFLVPWQTMLYNRLHCVIGDAMILLAAFWLVSLVWGRRWIACGRRLPLLMFVLLGLVYTVGSEYVNVSLRQVWAYSRWMPTLGIVGLVPLLQWLVVPLLSVWCCHRRTPLRCCKTSKGYSRERQS